MFKSRLFYLVALVLAYFLNHFFQTVETRAVFMCLIVLPAFSLLISYYTSRKILVSFEINESRIEKGGVAYIELSIKNPTLFLCPYLFINLTGSYGFALENSQLICSILPWRTQKVRVMLTGCYRGLFDIGIESCHIEDFLRLFGFNCDIPPKLKIVVTPQLKPVNPKFFQYYHNNLHAPNNVGSSDNLLSFYDVVPYDQSKDIRRIHWKLTARMNDLMVRNYDKENGVTAAVLADFSPVNGDDLQRLFVEDRLAEAFASVAHFLLQNYNAIDFVFADDIPYVLNNCSRFDFDKIFSVCSTQSFISKLSASELVAHYTELNACMNIIIITDKQNELPYTIENAIGKGFKFKVLYLGQADIKSNFRVEYFSFDEIYSGQ
ncbi:MAG TPA: DUF58 domain-containing protein [Clostridiales bacterium]|nr:DUF58 domain-containing protein [Clostridiales bacterium]